MKKIILSAALIAGMAFTACSSDDDSNNDNNNDGCVTCAAYDLGMGITMPEQEVCESPDGKAVVNGEDTGVPYTSYVENQRTVTTCE